MSQHPIITRRARPAWRRRLAPLAALWRAFVVALARSRQRRGLALLSDDLLDDIGLTREQAEAESLRSFWNLPGPHW